MPKVKHLFFSTDTNKRTLHRNITPSPRQQEMQQERWHDVRDYLIEDLKELTGLEITSWLQGSYKLSTQVRPAKKDEEFDIDLGIYFHWNEGEGADLTAKKLKLLTQESLLNYANEAEDEVLEVLTPPKERCARIRFPENFHIDIPAYHFNKTNNTCLLATESKGWEDSNPRDFHEWFENLFLEEENSQACRIIRYFKIWSQLHMKEPATSILLTVLIAEALTELSKEDVDSDDLTIRNVAHYIFSRLETNSDVRNPVNTKEPINRASEEETADLIKKLKDLVSLSEKALA